MKNNFLYLFYRDVRIRPSWDVLRQKRVAEEPPMTVFCSVWSSYCLVRLQLTRRAQVGWGPPKFKRVLNSRELEGRLLTVCRTRETHDAAYPHTLLGSFSNLCLLPLFFSCPHWTGLLKDKRLIEKFLILNLVGVQLGDRRIRTKVWVGGEGFIETGDSAEGYGGREGRGVPPGSRGVGTG